MTGVKVIAYADSGVVSGAEKVFARVLRDVTRRSGIRLDLAASPVVADDVARSGVMVERVIEIPRQMTRLAALALVDPRRRRLVGRALSGGEWDVALVNLPSVEYGATPLVGDALDGIPTVGVLHVHQTLSTLGFRLGGLRERIAGPALRRTTRLCVLSRWAAEQVSTGWGVPPVRIDVMPILEPEIERLPAGTARSRLGLSAGTLVGIAGRISFLQKGHDVLLDAAASFRDGGVEGVRFVVAGAGPDLPVLRREIARRQLEDRVLVLGHVAPIGLFLSAIDAIVIPSRFEGLPLIALEALWAGTPGIAARIDGLEQIWPRRWLAEPGDPAALARGLRSLLSMPETERAAVVAHARALVAASTASDLSPFFLDVLERAVTERCS
jgi:glycosyltransferase involved in cell wall biosynthesis